MSGRQGDEPGQGALSEGEEDEARPRRLLHRRRGRHRAHAVRAADPAAAFPDGIDGEQIYQKRVPRSAPSGWRRTRDLPLGPARGRARVTELAQVVWAANSPSSIHPAAAPRTRSTGRASHRHRPAARHDFRDAKRVGARARGPCRDRLRRLAEDLREPRRARLLPRIEPNWEFPVVRAALAFARRSSGGSRRR